MNVQTETPTHLNLSSRELAAASLARGESVLADNGSLLATTGKRTGRSPKDRYIVRDDITDATVDWGVVNLPTDPEKFALLWERAGTYLSERETFRGHYRVGQCTDLGLSVDVETEFAWHQLFVRNLFIDDGKPGASGEWTMRSAPNLHPDPKKDGVNSDGVVMINFSQKAVLLMGMPYAGEMKKSMFTALNFILPKADVLPMHCAANANEDGSNLALFFGLSGTGKTTLSADPDRFLVGDDEHGWSAEGVFNFEGGCYAKCIDLSKEREPVIYQAIKEGAIMENVVLDADNKPDYSDSSLTLNSRAAYPLEHIEKRVMKNAGDTPDAVIFLTCDLYGVLPPVARLSSEQAAYYFLSGYTALVGSTEMGSSDGVKPTFSTCFGAPFFPRPASVYADLLMKRVAETGCPVYLVNTGWTGGAYGEGGKRFAIPVTRAVVTSIINGTLETGETMPGFGFQLASSVPGVDAKWLDPRKNWGDNAAFVEKANTLIEKFKENFKRFSVSDAVVEAGPECME
jgi:phosphoenolpyruvate carboxykinase (ATP)